VHQLSAIIAKIVVYGLNQIYFGSLQKSKKLITLLQSAFFIGILQLEFFPGKLKD
jgi:hypothetical protein